MTTDSAGHDDERAYVASMILTFDAPTVGVNTLIAKIRSAERDMRGLLPDTKPPPEFVVQHLPPVTISATYTPTRQGGLDLGIQNSEHPFPTAKEDSIVGSAMREALDRARAAENTMGKSHQVGRQMALNAQATPLTFLEVAEALQAAPDPRAARIAYGLASGPPRDIHLPSTSIKLGGMNIPQNIDDIEHFALVGMRVLESKATGQFKFAGPTLTCLPAQARSRSGELIVQCEPDTEASVVLNLAQAFRIDVDVVVGRTQLIRSGRITLVVREVTNQADILRRVMDFMAARAA